SIDPIIETRLRSRQIESPLRDEFRDESRLQVGRACGVFPTRPPCGVRMREEDRLDASSLCLYNITYMLKECLDGRYHLLSCACQLGQHHGPGLQRPRAVDHHAQWRTVSRHALAGGFSSPGRNGLSLAKPRQRATLAVCSGPIERRKRC